MPGEIRVDVVKATTGLGTVSVNNEGIRVSGIVTATSFDGALLSSAAINGMFWNNGQTVTSNYTIPVSTNSGTFGPVGISTGVTVTISSGSYWTIV